MSSSAHLVIARSLLKVPSTGLLVEIVLHLGTLMSVMLYFRRDLWQWALGLARWGEEGAEARREVGYVLAATLPAVMVALALGDGVEAAFEEVHFTGLMLLVTTGILLSTRWALRTGNARMGLALALAMGTAQALAILPGISRSGITIAAGLWLGLGGVAAARFAFLMAIPAILGAGVYSLLDLANVSGQPAPGLWLGFLSAGLVGFGAIAWFMKILQQRRLHFFAGYTLLLGLLVTFWL